MKITIKKVLLIILAAILIGVVAGGVMFGVNSSLNYFFASGALEFNIPHTDTGSGFLIDQTEDAEVTVADVSAVVQESMPSIVAITTTTMLSSNDWYSYYYGQQEATGAGSGVILSKNDTELLIITSNHVVEGTDKVSVKFVDEISVEAVIKASNSKEDIAIVAVPLADIGEETLKTIKIATMAAEPVVVGEGVIAIGNALGYGQSVTTGVVSALQRDVTVDNLTLTLLQTDAAINPGNSGGALLNMQGELIGINEAKYSSNNVEGMGFAIPISEKRELVEQLLNAETKKKVPDSEKGYLGIYGVDVSADTAELYNIPEGVYVYRVVSGAGAEEAGIKEKDVITGLDGQEISRNIDLQNALEYYKIGETVTLDIMKLQNNTYIEDQVKVVLTGQ